MLRFINSDPDDLRLLEQSFYAIKQKDSLEIIVDGPERTKVLKQVQNEISIPNNGTFSILNLFKQTLSNGSFHIAQCIIDFGYIQTRKYAQTSYHSYYYQIIGVAEINVDLGKTLLRPETKIDKLVGRFFYNDIDFENSERFSDKYYLISNKKEQVYRTFDKLFLNVLSRYDNILLKTAKNTMFITFENELISAHSRIVEDIFGSCRFLSK